MGEMTDGDWGAIPYPPPPHDPPIHRGDKPPKTGDKLETGDKPPKTDEWPVRKVREEGKP